MSSYIVASMATREAIGEDFMDFLRSEVIPTTPRAIISEFDTRSESIFGWVADQARLSRAFEAAGRDTPNDITRGIINKSGPDQGAYAYPIREADISGLIFHDELGTEPLSVPITTEGLSVELSGNPSDHERYVLLHEAVHMEHGDLIGRGLFGQRHIHQYEFDADNRANHLYYEAYNRGLVENPELPYEFRAMRAMRTVMRPADRYDLNGLSTLPSEDRVFPEGEYDAARDSVQQAVDKLYTEIGRSLVDENDPLMRLEIMSNLEHSYVEGAEEEFVFSDDLRERLYDALDNEDHEAAERILEEIEIPPEYEAFINEEMERNIELQQESEGISAIQENPALAYETARMMLERGDFDDNPVGKQLMENFTDGAQRYAPEEFGVDPADIPEGRPAIIDRLAQEYAPAAEPAAGQEFENGQTHESTLTVQ